MVKILKNPPWIGKPFLFLKNKNTLSVLFVLILTVGFLVTYIQFQKQQDIRQQAAYDPATRTFIATFDGTPQSPLPYTQMGELPNFDIQIESRDQPTWPALQTMEADHGMDCSGSADNMTFPIHVTNGNYPDAVFQCNNHLMTSIQAGGYGEIVLTPTVLADISNGQTAVIDVDVSTFKSSTRDWWDIVLSPYAENVPLPLENWLPDLDGFPRDGIHLNNGGVLCAQEQMVNGVVSDIPGCATWIPLDDQFGPGSGLGMTLSKQIRSTFEIRLSKTHITTGIRVAPINGACLNSHWTLNPSTGRCEFNWSDVDLATPLSYDQVVVQFGHHDYNPSKDNSCIDLAPDGTCRTTWHWDNFKITPAIPFTVIKANDLHVLGNVGSVVSTTFPTPAPANAFLRFSAVCTVEYSLNDGPFTFASLEGTTKHVAGDRSQSAGAATPYFIAVPAGTNKVTFRFGTDGWYDHFPCKAEGMALWSTAATQTITPVSTTTPTNTPIPTIPPLNTPTTVQPTPTPTRTPTPVPPTPTPLPTATPTPAGIIGDINGDGKVNVQDMSYVLSKWGTGDPLADLNHSGTVDVFDLSILLSNWKP